MVKLLSIKKLISIEKAYEDTTNNTNEYYSYAENISNKGEFLNYINNVYEDGVDTYINCSNFISNLKKIGISLNNIFNLNSMDEVNKFLKRKKKGWRKKFLNSNLRVESKYSSFKSMELEKKLTNLDNIFISLNDDIKYIFKWIMLINLYCKKHSTLKNKKEIIMKIIN